MESGQGTQYRLLLLTHPDTSHQVADVRRIQTFSVGKYIINIMNALDVYFQIIYINKLYMYIKMEYETQIEIGTRKKKLEHMTFTVETQMSFIQTKTKAQRIAMQPSLTVNL